MINRTAFWNLIASERSRPLVPAILKRLNECSDSDAADIQHLINIIPSKGQVADQSYSWTLGLNIIMSEMYSNKKVWPSIEQV
jgi:hypothetical protein